MKHSACFVKAKLCFPAAFIPEKKTTPMGVPVSHSPGNNFHICGRAAACLGFGNTFDGISVEAASTVASVKCL